ncbi:MAG: HAMP domain-containing histidine kinase [Methanomassiliicoccales archaeon]|nr:HAMP domain-containing histidine kinase [Methanomassiliicoccales archaeon]
MPDTTNLIICEEMLSETEAAIMSEGLSKVRIFTYPASWCHGRVDWTMVSKLMTEKSIPKGRSCIIITDKMGLIIDPPKDMGRWKKVNVRHLTDLFLAEGTVEALERDGAYPMLPARAVACLDEGRPAISQTNTALRKVVLVDVLQKDGLSARARDLGQRLGLPCEVMTTAIDIFRLNIVGILLRSMLEAESESHRSTQAAMDKTKADYAMIFDVLDRISRVMDETSVVGSVLDLFTVLFSPRTIMYASERNGSIENMVSRGKTLEVLWNPNNVAEMCGTSSYALTKAGFCLRVRSMDKTLGWLEVMDLEYPQHKERYLELAKAICDVFALSLSNARAFQEMKKMQDVILDLNEAMRLINKTMRHDMMNEMTIVSGALQLYRSKHEERKLDMAENSVIRSIRLIEDMKELESGIMANKASETVRVRETITKVLSTFDLPSSIEGEEVLVTADAAFHSVLENIVRNAIKHGKTDRVHVSIRINGHNCTVSVMDWGKGIPDSIKTKIFEEGFSYGSTSGSGLGLYIVMKVMKRYGGTIGVRDNVPNGAIIDLTLPIADEELSERSPL